MDHFMISMDHSFLSVAIAARRETILGFTLLSSLHSNYIGSYLSVVSL